MATCKSCGAVIEWVPTAYGNVMPLDAEPSDGGNLVCLGGQVRAKKAGDKGPFRTSHFATCPGAAAYRELPRTRGRSES